MTCHAAPLALLFSTIVVLVVSRVDDMTVGDVKRALAALGLHVRR
jgi:hypothetical protein